MFFRLLLGGIAGKVLGIVREVLLAALFGAGRVVGANRVALTGTLVPVNFFTADALSAGFLPLYVEYRRDAPAMALPLYRAVRMVLAGLSMAMLLGLLVARSFWVDLLAPGLDESTSALTASMLSIAAIGVPFLVLYSLNTLVALARDDVRLINLRASFQSVGLITATIVAYVTGDVVVLAWGFTAPYAILWCWSEYWLRRKRYLTPVDDDSTGPPPGQSPGRIALAMFWRRLRPLLIVPVLLQGSIGVERAVGSLLGIEVVAATEYSRFVVDSLMALIAAPLGLAGLAAFARKLPDQVRAGLENLVAPVLLATVPLSIALGINSRGIISVLYARGQFDERAVDVSSIMLLGFSLGIWANVLGHTLVKVLNARGANSRVAIVNGLSFATAAIVNLVMWRYWGPITLGIASTVTGLVMFTGAALSLRIARHCAGLLLLLAPGVAVAAGVGWLLAGDGILRLAASCTAIGLVWLGYLLCVPRLRAVFVTRIWSRLAARFRKPAPPVPAPPVPAPPVPAPTVRATAPVPAPTIEATASAPTPTIEATAPAQTSIGRHRRDPD